MSSPRMKGFKEYIRVDEAMEKFIQGIGKTDLGSETIYFQDALGRVLSDDIISPVDSPPYNKAAMDGYAVHAEDTFGASQSNPISLMVVGEIHIGVLHKVKAGRREAVFVATGAQMPRGADAVVMVEYTTSSEHSEVDVVRPVSPHENVSKIGEDVKKGETVLRRGTRIRPHDIGIFSALGLFKVRVVKTPKIAILSTGTELIQPGENLPPGKSFNINGPALAAMVKEWGGMPIDLGIATDDENDIRTRITKGLSETDALVISAGSSVGKRDIIPDVVSSLGNPGILAHGLAMRPSSPTGLAVVDHKPIIMLPGYPVSAIIAFSVFGRALLYKLLGSRAEPDAHVRASISRRIASAGGMKTYVRVRIRKEGSQYIADPIRTSGASVLSSIISADGMIVISEDQEGIEAGDSVEVVLLRPVTDN